MSVFGRRDFHPGRDVRLRSLRRYPSQSPTTQRDTMTITPDKIADLRVKQLEIVQSIIARIASYGANLKNYCITLTTAICGFAITLHRPLVIVSAIVPVVVFMLLDAQFLRVERRFRALFDQLRGDWDVLPRFAINLQSAPEIRYWSVLTSWSILIFYLPLAIAVTAVLMISGQIYGRYL
jgi:hypothetical protein